MKHKEQLEMIARVITLPFSEFTLYDDDIIGEYLKCHYHLFVESKFDPIRVKALKKKLKGLEDKITLMIAQKTHSPRLDSVQQIINAFYSPYQITKNGAYDYEWSYLNYMFRVAQSFLTFRDGRPSIKWWISSEDDIFSNNSRLSEKTLDKIELWNTLMRVFTPDVLIAALYASSANVSVFNLLDVREYVSLPDKPLAKILEKGIAETHLHMNAGLGYLNVWEASCDIIAFDNPDEPELLVAGILRLYFAFVIGSNSKSLSNKKDSEENYEAKNDEDEMKAKNNSLLKNFCNILHLPDCFLYTRLGTQCSEIGSKAVFKKLYEEFKESKNKIIDAIEKFINTQKNYRDILQCFMPNSYKDLHTPYEIIMEFLLFRKLRDLKNSDSKENEVVVDLLHMVVQYLRIKNKYFEDKVLNNLYRGLSNFVQFFDRATDARYKLSSSAIYQAQTRKDSMLCVFENMCSQTSLRKLEIRISPNIKNIYNVKNTSDKDLAQRIGGEVRKQLITIFEAYIDYYNQEIDQYLRTNPEAIKLLKEKKKTRSDFADDLQYKNIVSFPALGIIYHFVKDRDLDNFLTNSCWVFDSIENGQQTVQNKRDRYCAFVRVLQTMRAKIPNLSKYIVGIDAAAIENETEPWVLAPVFLQARDFASTYPSEVNGKRINNLGLTYHVGEDFYHLLSGLRHIDEVVNNYGYISGDRIAHAIALQLNAFEWASENPVVAIPQGEYLDNLLWLWSLNARRPEILKGINVDFENKIMMVVEQIYGSNSGLTPYILWQAYTEKFKNISQENKERMKSWYISENTYNLKEDEMGNMRANVLCKYYSIQCPKECVSAMQATNSRWDKDKLAMTFHCPIHNRNYNKSIFVSVTNEDAECIDAVQRFVKHELEATGIYVEVNPTSNAIIGDIRGMYRHPFSNLNDSNLSEGENRVLMSINSDDPLVFCTNAENEIAIAYYTLLHKGYSREQALSWIDKVRQSGMESSFIKLEIMPSSQKEEIEQLIKELNDYDFSNLFVEEYGSIGLQSGN